MEERERFQNQMPDSKDYEKTEKKAEAVKTGGEILGVGALLVIIGKKYGPALLKKLSKLRKI